MKHLDTSNIHPRWNQQHEVKVGDWISKMLCNNSWVTTWCPPNMISGKLSVNIEPILLVLHHTFFCSPWRGLANESLTTIGYAT
jgi:hypothetical protein